ncbi:MAG TPA: hypothetical protein VKI18_12100 [Albitalea sp.]|nr:hypothetical protein [Albitalea sp.]
MITSTHATGAQPGYQLCFRSIADAQRACSFPCDADGHVDMDALGERLCNAYLFARTVIGREFAMPRVQPCSA